MDVENDQFPIAANSTEKSLFASSLDAGREVVEVNA
jgi:hypothetical protein